MIVFLILSKNFITALRVPDPAALLSEVITGLPAAQVKFPPSV